ncbi:MAG: GH3 auxin-responsive promoter family protein, partial [Polyangiaceae bacterium]|nr:GH3 auxin-responsive promoter family protein [Polyangiaceae bacterium]
MNELSQEAPRPVQPPRSEGDARGAAGDETESSLVQSVYPRVVGNALRAAALVQVASWDAALWRLRAVQEATLLSLLRHSANTSFGRAHSFTRVRNYASFVCNVPVGDYDSFSPLIDRMRAGERNLLVPEAVRYFANSSGSSNHGRSKFLPITERQIRFQQRAGADALMRYVHWSGNDEILCGFTLGLFPPTT